MNQNLITNRIDDPTILFFDAANFQTSFIVSAKEMKFVAIDFETANPNRSSACSVGLAHVEDGKIIKNEHFLIRPEPNEFSPFHVSIHGITEQMVKDAPTFKELWPTLSESIQGLPLIAHNASFDMSVLRYCLDDSNMPYPETNYFCTLVISRLTWTDRYTYTLDHLADSLGIPFDHHNAKEDAKACALIAIEACRVHGINSIFELENVCGLRIGELNQSGYVSCGCQNGGYGHGNPLGKLSKPSQITPTTDSFDSSHPFFGKAFVFTGTLTSMSRSIAAQKVVDVGGHCHDSVKKDTDFLVIGQSGFVGYCEGHKSSKLKKAEMLRSKGSAIEIMPEEDFIRLI